MQGNFYNLCRSAKIFLRLTGDKAGRAGIYSLRLMKFWDRGQSSPSLRYHSAVRRSPSSIPTRGW